MAKPHHRKKHKEHLRQFRHSHEMTKTVKAKGKASSVFAVGGSIAGSLLGYFAGNGSWIWAAAGLVVVGLAGYIIGQRVDH